MARNIYYRDFSVATMHKHKFTVSTAVIINQVSIVIANYIIIELDNYEHAKPNLRDKKMTNQNIYKGRVHFVSFKTGKYLI